MKQETLGAITQTIINSNGSKWNGQSPDKIETLMETLKENTIESRFFKKYKKIYADGSVQWITLCPISKQHPLSGGRNKHYTFFGNFEEVSHVFNIETNEPEVIASLKAAILQNTGWKKYVKNLKVKAKF